MEQRKHTVCLSIGTSLLLCNVLISTLCAQTLVGIDPGASCTSLSRCCTTTKVVGAALSASTVTLESAHLLQDFKVTVGADKAGPTWAGNWYRLDVGLDQVDPRGLWHHMIPPGRRVPLPSRVDNAPPQSDAARAERHLRRYPVASRPAGAVLKSLPGRDVWWAVAVGRDTSTLVLKGCPDGKERQGSHPLAVHKVKLDGVGRPNPAEVLNTAARCMLRQGFRPRDIFVGNPSITDLMGVHVYEELFEAIDVAPGLAAPKNRAEGAALKILKILDAHLGDPEWQRDMFPTVLGWDGEKVGV